MPADMNDDDVMDIAGQLGASVRANGRKFNAANVIGARRGNPLNSERMDRQLGHRTVSEIAQEQQGMAELVDVVQEGQAEMLRALINALARIQRNPPPVTVEAPQIHVAPAEVKAARPVAWTFEFERNSNGLITKAHCTPKL